MWAVLVGIISDSHDNVWALEKAVKTLLSRGVEAFLHLGDIVSPFTLRAAGRAGARRLIAVYGNNCGERLVLREVAEALGFEIHVPPHMVSLDGLRLLMVHGWGSAEKTLTVVDALAASGRFDAVLYGHTHRPDVRLVGDTLVINPGELCGCLTGRRTIAILDTETGKADILEI